MHFSQREYLVEVKFERNEKMEGATVTGFKTVFLSYVIRW